MGSRVELRREQRFGRLVAIAEHGVVNGHYVWLFRCDCGNEVLRIASHVKRGHTQSCGCLHNSGRSPYKGPGRFDENGRPTPEYQAWLNMIDICKAKSRRSWPRESFASRGITVCKRWRNSFNNFLADMGKKPSRRHRLTRINKRRGYTPKNCRWTTPSDRMEAA